MVSVASTLEVLPPESEITPEQRDQLRVINDFDHFCDQFVFIHDKRSRQAIRFDRYDCQREMSALLLGGKWIVCLKARQLGQTWLLAIYTLWRLMTVPGYEACVVQQNRDYAKDFLRRVKYVYYRLPVWLQVGIANDSRYEISFDHGMGEESCLRVIAGSETAGRSITGDLMVFDEHAYVPSAREAREGCEPSVEMSQGQIVCLTTSAGPQGDFHDIWKEAPGNKYNQVFFGWDAHPLRDQKWFDTEAARHKGDKLFMGREYPSTPEEAFQHAEGRCYPSFSVQRNAQTFDQIGLNKEYAELYRAVDFGSVHPWVCLWIAHWAKEPSGLTVDPACVETIREFVSYRFDKTFAHGKERPKKVDDHAMDALRYLVIHGELTGHVHIYRECYVTNSTAKGHTDLTDVDNIHRLSGWVECDEHEKARYKPGPNAEHFVTTMCDRSEPKTIELYCLNDIPSEPYKKPDGAMVGTDVLDGIRRIGVLIEGTRTIFKTMAEDPRRAQERRLSPLEVAAIHELEQNPKRRAIEKRRKRSMRRRYTLFR